MHHDETSQSEPNCVAKKNKVTGVHSKFHIMLQHGPRAVRVGSQKLWAMDRKKDPPSDHPFFGHLTTPLW